MKRSKLTKWDAYNIKELLKTDYQMPAWDADHYTFLINPEHVVTVPGEFDEEGLPVIDQAATLRNIKEWFLKKWEGTQDLAPETT